MADSGLIKKLMLKPGQKAAVFNPPAEKQGRPNPGKIDTARLILDCYRDMLWYPGR